MRDWFLLAVVFAPLLVLGFWNGAVLTRLRGYRAIGIGWFVVGALILGWYDGWVKRALVGILIFIPLMAPFRLVERSRSVVDGRL